MRRGDSGGVRREWAILPYRLRLTAEAQRSAEKAGRSRTAKPVLDRIGGAKDVKQPGERCQDGLAHRIGLPLRACAPLRLRGET